MFRLFFATLAVALGAAFLFSSCASTNGSSDPKAVKHYNTPHQTGTNL